MDQIIVYKIDRLTRSLGDFSKIVDVLDAAKASFVSVTQSFNTATSMGRLTLNMLLSFAQFEREVTAERIRDKIAASKRKGLWMGGNLPMGYDADGRTLKINDLEAKTIRHLYKLYEERQTVRAVKEEADQLSLRTKKRKRRSGTVSGGGAFDRGHIHHILTNPIYAGRIRHKTKVFEGLHPAIIAPERWDAIQNQLKEGAVKTRQKRTSKQSSLLCGKLFDETGDRLTPSHSKTRAGTRLRYYVSHRLIKRSGEQNLDGWRLPAKEFESKVAQLAKDALLSPSFCATVLVSLNATERERCRTKLKDYTEKGAREALDFVECVDLAPGHLKIKLSIANIADLLRRTADELSPEHLTIRTQFQLRKRGVETKIIISDAPTGIDEALIQNIAKANHWYGLVKQGQTFKTIARSQNTSSDRIQKMIGLAFLAPDLLRQVMQGKQPLGFTSDWAMRCNIPSDWNEQRALFATL
ncbi:MAG: recombinase family protein [Paracoccaceae bacterium]|nr:recombinase family protein [Paracoccaceae bacterium]